MTGTLQNFARKYTVAIDELSYEYELYNLTEQDNLKERPADGAYIKGLFLEGAGWDFDKKVLVDDRG